MAVSRLMGARVRRKEDPRLITGSATYVGDLALPRTLHCAILRSPYAHARVRRVDTAAAEALPGVVAVFTGQRLKALAGPMLSGSGEGDVQEEAAEATSDQREQGLQYALAVDQVRHVGEAVAAVVAEDAYVARDALELIEVAYESLPVALGVSGALAEGAPTVMDDKPGNVANTWQCTAGDVDAAFAEARQSGVVLDLRIVSQRLAGIPMEGRAVVAAPDSWHGGLTVWTSVQNPHSVRTLLAKVLGMPESDLRVIAPEVGGGFGVKIGFYPEDVIVAAIARALGRPVKWTETRSENLLATNHGRDQEIEAQVAARKDGVITALRERITGDIGSYPREPGLAVLTGQMAVGVYGIPNVDLEARSVHTHTMSVAAYRGAGRPEACYYLERIVDQVADALGLDPAEVRRRNFIAPDRFPYQTPTGLTYDSGNYAPTLDKALELVGYQALRDEQRRLRQQGRYLGIGLSFYIEMCGFGPYESASVRVEPSGTVTVMTGISPHGQGQETTFAQIVADVLGVGFDRVQVRHGDTSNTPVGQGTMGSRGLVTGGSALLRAIGKIQERARRVAAHLLEASADDVEFADGRWQVKGAPERAKSLADVAAAAYGGTLPPEIEPGLEATDFFRPPGLTYPAGAHVAVVEVDPETGEVHLRRYVAVDDCGRVVSPLLVEGQVHGGIAQGVGQALYEQVVYDEQGQLITGTLLDYAVPIARYLPSFETARTETPSPLNPLGAKGIGEAATVASTPAVANAVMDALRPFGVQHLDLPLTAERVWRAMQNGKPA